MTAARESDELTLILGGQAIAGWTDIRIGRGIERCPSDFEIGMTEKFPGELTDLVVTPGEACTVKLGSDTVITGYVDIFEPTIRAEQHGIRVVGRSKCSGLVDCSAICPTMVINNNNVLGIAQKLAAPFDVTVSTLVPPSELAIIPQYCVNVTESPYDAIQLYSSYSGVLAYDQPDGNLVLARVSSTKAASGFVEGQNVIAATVRYAMDNRYSVYEVVPNSIDTLTDFGASGFVRMHVTDPNVPRYRPMLIVAENNNGIAVSKMRAKWEMARRAGRSKVVRLTCDSWRDAAGSLWTPNTIADVQLPSCKLESAAFTIGELTYRRDGENGTTCELELMGSASYAPEPIQLSTLPLEFSEGMPPPGANGY